MSSCLRNMNVYASYSVSIDVEQILSESASESIDHDTWVVHFYFITKALIPQIQSHFCPEGLFRHHTRVIRLHNAKRDKDFCSSLSQWFKCFLTSLRQNSIQSCMVGQYLIVYCCGIPHPEIPPALCQQILWYPSDVCRITHWQQDWWMPQEMVRWMWAPIVVLHKVNCLVEVRLYESSFIFYDLVM